MSSWTDGYVADINYTFGYYRELTPPLLNFAALSRGHRAPNLAGELTYCELGCGQGFTANLIAAANPNIQVYATDFNPAQITYARALATAGNVDNVHFSDQSFEEYLQDESLPQFDYITLHGILTWISAENRQHIVDFIRKKLKVGGLVYASFNVLPGWASGMPLRRLFVDHANSTSGPLHLRIDKALMFAERLKEANVAYFRDNASAGKRLENIRSQNRSYLAHEYFNRDWTPFYFADIADTLDGAKLSYLGSAHLLDHVDGINLRPEHQQLLNEVADLRFRETLRDYATMQQFRRDIFVRGAMMLTTGEAQEAWLDSRFALSKPRAEFEMKVLGALGDVMLQEEVYNPLLDQLAEGPKTLRQMIAADPKIKEMGWPRVQEALRVLVGSTHVHPCLDAKGDSKRGQRTRLLNSAISKRTVWVQELQHLASPVTGAAVPCDRFQQMFAIAQSEKAPDPPAKVWEAIAGQGQKLVKEGKTLETAEENLAEIRTRYDAFCRNLPMFQKLGVL